MKRLTHASFAFLCALLPARIAAATDYYVASNGDDSATGTQDKPWATIGKAASTLQAGDSVTVHAGTYREWVNPTKGGTKTSPVTYQAADGEDVYIKGSERITNWTQSGSVWTAVVPNATFGSFNPYSTAFTGDYMTSGSDHHLGAVYLEGKPYTEMLAAGDVMNTPETWTATVDGTNTTITANFGSADPNAGNAEINVREYAFFPSTTGLNYITVHGFHIMHGATQWAPPDVNPQDGLIGTNWGMGWTIENNYISDAKAVCVSGGLPSGNNFSEDIDKSGNHVIRHNTIERCNEAGIAGSHGLVASVIQGNLIQDIHPANSPVSGYECAGIKIHTAVDVLIENNVIRNVGGGAFAVWLDWQAQGSRITSNVFYNLNDAAIQLEANHGPTLIDNNVLIGFAINDWSEATVYVHNLIKAPASLSLTDSRTPGYFHPHTTNQAGTAMHASADNKYYNNIFVSQGTDGVSQQPGFACDYNVYYNGAPKTSWGDAHSLSDSADAMLTTTDMDNGVTVSFKATSAPHDVAAPLITHDFIGLATLTMQGIENHDGSPITIDHDITGAARDATHPTAGPLEMLGTTNTIQVLAGTDLTGNGGGTSGGSGGAPATGGSSGTQSGSGGHANGGTTASGGKGTGGSGTGTGGDASGGEAGATGTSGNGAGGSDNTGGASSGGNGTSGASGNGSAGKSSGGAANGAGGSSQTSGGSSGASTGASGGAGSGAKDSSSKDDKGCGCAIPTKRGTPVGTWLTALSLASALFARRRRAALFSSRA